MYNIFSKTERTSGFLVLFLFYFLPMGCSAGHESEYLLQQSDLEYLGSFKLPHGKYDPFPSNTVDNTLSYAGGCLTYNPLRDSLYIRGHAWLKVVGEVSIPDLKQGVAVNRLSTSEVLTKFIDLSGGTYSLLGPPDHRLIGNGGNASDFIFYDGKLFGVASTFYDATCQAILSHYYIDKLTWDFNKVLAIDINSNILTLDTDWEDGKKVLVLQTKGTLPHGLTVNTPYTIKRIAAKEIMLLDDNGDEVDIDATENELTAMKMILYTDVGFHGFFQLGKHPSDGENIDNTFGLVPQSGFVSGYLCSVPETWQEDLKGKVLCGNGATAIISRTSLGPALFSFNPEDLYETTPNLDNNESYAPATPLVYYPINHPELGMYGSSSMYFHGGGDKISDSVFVEGTRSVIVFGTKGIGDFCYGTGTSDPSLHLQPVPGTNGKVHYCYDPINGSKGCHGYPYIYYAWVYDANDMIDVVNHIKRPWQVKPYAIWAWDAESMPYGINWGQISSVAYDKEKQLLYVGLSGAEKTTYSSYPIIDVFRVNVPNEEREDIVPPKIFEVAPVKSEVEEGEVVNYIFFSNEAGRIEYEGDCAGDISDVSFGRNEIRFFDLPAGKYACNIRVIDEDGNYSEPLTISFLVTGRQEYDVNQDGNVNVLDIQIIVNVILGNVTNNLADVNNDGAIDTNDIQTVVNRIIS